MAPSVVETMCFAGTAGKRTGTDAINNGGTGKLFKNQSLLDEHYSRHGQEIADVLGDSNYSIDKYFGLVKTSNSVEEQSKRKKESGISSFCDTASQVINGMTFSEKVHTTLDIAGMVPVLGEVCDATNAVIYLMEGNFAEAAVSGAACIPGWGNASVRNIASTMEKIFASYRGIK